MSPWRPVVSVSRQILERGEAGRCTVCALNGRDRRNIPSTKCVYRASEKDEDGKGEEHAGGM